jgi:hypothetical protein
MEASRASVENPKGTNRTQLSDTAKIFAIIRDMPNQGNDDTHKELSYDDIRARVRSHGFTDELLEDAINEFDMANVWSLTENGTKLRFL